MENFLKTICPASVSVQFAGTAHLVEPGAASAAARGAAAGGAGAGAAASGAAPPKRTDFKNSEKADLAVPTTSGSPRNLKNHDAPSREIMATTVRAAEPARSKSLPSDPSTV